MNALAYLPVIAAGLVPFIVGSMWYHPKIFGERWMRMKRVTPEMAERSSRFAMHSTVVMLVLGMVSAFVLSRILVAFVIESYGAALVAAAGIWIGFVVPVTINRVLWDHEPIALYGIEIGQWLISLSIMAIVLMD